MNHKDLIAIKKIISEIEMAQKFIGNLSVEEFTNNEIVARAVALTVINIGELVKVTSDETRTASSNIPWKAAARFRDIAAHHYQSIDMAVLYNTVKDDFPPFKAQLEKLIAE